MTLTRRRKEFLQKLKEIYENTRTPVHYITVAKALGVSKWTAYDILKDLEKEGYLRSEYSVSREERYPGRSVILFLPTPKAGELFLKEKDEIDHMEEWHAAQGKLLEILENVKKHGLKNNIDILLEDIPTTEAPIIISAKIIFVMIVYIQRLGTETVKIMKNLLQPALRPELVLSLFVGAALGVTVKNKNIHGFIYDQLADEVSQFQKYISEFSVKENKLLVSFLGDALERAV
ncbi:MAG: Lrp/AsnC family transcriptional regulator [Firmicutes bacterium]|nr:Lrp/AsnC family transcriptional regulator [Bacillota bacterium]